MRQQTTIDKMRYGGGWQCWWRRRNRADYGALESFRVSQNFPKPPQETPGAHIREGLWWRQATKLVIISNMQNTFSSFQYDKVAVNLKQLMVLDEISRKVINPCFFASGRLILMHRTHFIQNIWRKWPKSSIFKICTAVATKTTSPLKR